MAKFIPAGLAGLAICACFAQTAAAPAFDVASVKYDPRKAGSWIRFQTGGRLDASSWLKQLIQVAYDVNDYQVLGGPAWLGDDWYAIEAKAPDPDTDEKRMKLMLQTLLSERFQLRLREETRDLPVYHLVVAKGGPKLRELKDGEKSACARGNSLICGMRTTRALADWLQYVAGRPVIDKTGITGTYDILINFDIYSLRGQTPPPDYNQPDMTTALQEQLGLRLEPAKDPMPVLVVESVQRPGEN